MRVHACDLVLSLFLLPCVSASRVNSRVHVVADKGRAEEVLLPRIGAGIAKHHSAVRPATTLPGFRTPTEAPQTMAPRYLVPSIVDRQNRLACNAMMTASEIATPKFLNGVDLTGKVAFIVGASSETGYGFAIAKELAQAGATILFGSWPMTLQIFRRTMRKQSFKEAATLPNGSVMEISKVYPLDVVYDEPSQVPEDVLNNKRYKDLGSGFTIQEVVDQVKHDYGHIDILVHATANGPEVKKPLLETSREGYLAASSASAYSLVSMVSRFGPIMRPGGAVISISYVASTQVIPGYGGGMSSAKASLESDTRLLAYEAGQKYGIRVNTICAGPLATRAATAISDGDGKPFIMRAIEYSEANAPLPNTLVAKHIGTSALFLLSDMAAGVTGCTLPVDMGLNIMGNSRDSPAFQIS